MNNDQIKKQLFDSYFNAAKHVEIVKTTSDFVDVPGPGIVYNIRTDTIHRRGKFDSLFGLFDPIVRTRHEIGRMKLILMENLQAKFI